MTGRIPKTLLLIAAAVSPASAQELPTRLNPAFVAYISTAAAATRAFTPLAGVTATEPRRSLGHNPAPIEYSRLSGHDFSSAIPGRTSISGVTPPVSFSASYDLRLLGKLPPVRNQGAYGDCWAFATLASMESWLLPSESWDFSESNMAKNSGFDGTPMADGGNSFMSSAYLLRWSGPVTEADDPHDAIIRSGLTVQKHSQELRWLPPPASVNEAAFKNNIKSSIETYGAVYSSLYWDDSAADGSSTNFYNDRCTKAYGVSGSVCTCGAPGTCGGHAIALVGWNDSYSAANFPSAPPGNGAFIARNSWGTGYGESGYFYISYYDTSLGGDNAIFNSAESAANYNAVYQYDPLGYTYDLGNGDTGGADSTTEWMANIFTASASGLIKSAGFYATDANASYTIYVYTGVTPGTPRSGTLAYSASGSFTLPGYYTVPFSSPVGVLSGETFSVVVRLTNPSYTYPVAVEKPYSDYSSGALASAGQSYFSNNGTSWTDLTSLWANTNACLKVYQYADSTPPSAVAAVYDGPTTGSDISTTGSLTQLSANWPASADAESGISAYYYAIGTAPGGTNVAGWTSNGLALSVTRSGLSLTHGQTYYFSVKAMNGAGVFSAETRSNGQTVDTQSPADVAYVHDGTEGDIDYVRSLTTLSAYWAESPSEGIDRYEYAIGTTPGGTQTVGWTSTGLNTYVTRSGLTLAQATTYYFSVKAHNTGGFYSTPTTSDGQKTDTLNPSAKVEVVTTLPARTGLFTAKLIVTEANPLPAAPQLRFVTSTGLMVPLSLTFLTGSTWSVSGYIESYYSTGTAAFQFSAADAAGNTGTSITSGGTFTINYVLSGAAGGSVYNSDGAGITLPAGAYSGNILLSVSTAPAAALAGPDAASPDSFKIYGYDLARDFSARTTAGAPVTSFAAPVTITLGYPDANDDGRIDMDLIDESRAWIYYLDPTAGRWIPVPGVTRDPGANTLSAQVSHFSVYAVRAAGDAGPGIGELRAYPNPCDLRAASSLTIDGVPIDAAGTKAYIFNSAGELVRELTRSDGISSLNSISWNGRDKNGARAASGLYLYVVKTDNRGKGSGKFFLVW
ncbi:MAG: lectin like domain-containing protein [Elusimicrobiales bacterium]